MIRQSERTMSAHNHCVNEFMARKRKNASALGEI